MSPIPSFEDSEDEFGMESELDESESALNDLEDESRNLLDDLLVNIIHAS